MKIRTIALLVFTLSTASLWVASCSLLDPEDVHALPAATSTIKDSSKASHRTPIVPKTGTVHQIWLLDSHSWAIEGEDGTWYDPVDLPDSLKLEGARIQFTFERAQDWGYTYAQGQLVELRSVALLK